MLSPVTLCDPLDDSLPGSSSMGFSRQEYWSGLPFPSPGDLPKPGIKSVSPALTGRFLTTEPSGKHPTNRRHELMESASLSFTGTSLTEFSKVSSKTDYQLSTEEASSVTWHFSHIVSHFPTPSPLIPSPPPFTPQPLSSCHPRLPLRLSSRPTP